MTGQDIINEALEVLVVIYPGQTISPEAQATSLLGLNNLLDEWNAQGPMAYSIKKSTFALTGGTADYTIGVGGTLNTTVWVPKIEYWRVIDTSGAANGGKPVSSPEFALRADDNSLQAARVEMLWYDPAFPLGSVHLYPKPAGGNLELGLWDQLAVITDATAALSLPPGYGKALIYNLAVDLAPKFGRPLDATVAQVAMESKQALMATNMSEMTRMPQQPPQQQQPPPRRAA